ncbi:hypothetical protein L2E82_11444 [Cichorium intybus]|uniref:Uncharacterized protein n=1 Tax=Cichorium intybus TaxID=13427 RepID=A0ACB9GDC2_CICIN|nr:hypothetical protein L2E82_11444 [Cichorium intybus]
MNMQGFAITNKMEMQLPSFPGSQPIERSSLSGGMVVDRMGGAAVKWAVDHKLKSSFVTTVKLYQQPSKSLGKKGVKKI